VEDFRGETKAAALKGGATREKAARRSQWHRHSCLPRGTKGRCEFAKPGTPRLADPMASVARDFPWPPWRLIANLELEFPATRRKQSLRLKSPAAVVANRKYFAISQMRQPQASGTRAS
jgi:hypothetical protein